MIRLLLPLTYIAVIVVIVVIVWSMLFLPLWLVAAAGALLLGGLLVAWITEKTEE